MIDMFMRLFSWIKSLFIHNGDRWDIYLPNERGIYPYFNGERMVNADPIALYKRVMEVWPELSIDATVARSTLLADKETIKGHTAMTDKIRGIFQLKPLTNGIECVGTLTDKQATDLLDHLLIYCERLKKNSSRSATLSTKPADLPPSSEASQATPPLPASGCAASEPPIAGPGPSPSEQQSPSASTTPA